MYIAFLCIAHVGDATLQYAFIYTLDPIYVFYSKYPLENLIVRLQSISIIRLNLIEYRLLNCIRKIILLL